MSNNNHQGKALGVLTSFVVLLASRDIAYELWLRPYFGFPGFDDGVSKAMAIAVLGCAFVSLASALFVTFQGRWKHLIERLKAPGVAWRATSMGALCAVVYGVTFTLIGEVGAGLFDLIDWGLAPFATAGLAIAFWPQQNRDIRRSILWLSLTVGLAGLVGLYATGPLQRTSPQWILIALSSPLATAGGLALQSWLLQSEGGDLNRSEVLFLRFTPAAVVLAALCFSWYRAFPHVEDPAVTLLPAMALFALPAVAVCWALVRAALGRFAAWEFAIPALTFFGTLHAHADHRRPLPIAMACLVVSGVLLFETFGTRQNNQ